MFSSVLPLDGTGINQNQRKFFQGRGQRSRARVYVRGQCQWSGVSGRGQWQEVSGQRLVVRGKCSGASGQGQESGVSGQLEVVMARGLCQWSGICGQGSVVIGQR